MASAVARGARMCGVLRGDLCPAQRRALRGPMGGRHSRRHPMVDERGEVGALPRGTESRVIEDAVEARIAVGDYVRALEDEAERHEIASHDGRATRFQECADGGRAGEGVERAHTGRDAEPVEGAANEPEQFRLVADIAHEPEGSEADDAGNICLCSTWNIVDAAAGQGSRTEHSGMAPSGEFRRYIHAP